MVNMINRSMRIKDLANYAHRRALFSLDNKSRLAWVNVEQILRTQMDAEELIEIPVPKGIKRNGKKKEKEKVDD